MSSPNDFRIYVPGGKTISERGVSLPPFEEAASKESPENYVADKSLADAVNVSLLLGQPLLVSGEPGTGKTQLAYSIAHQLGQSRLTSPLTYYTKNSSVSKDLFYQYDALRHFQDSRVPDKHLDKREYITYEALGLAVLLTLAPDDARRAGINKYLHEDYRDVGAVRPVVLIDEIDKAPREMPNDILNEIETMSFRVMETGQTFEADLRYKPIVVLTTNSEKDLPAAFLRRCVFYYIPFPSNERLQEIVRKRLELSPDFKLRRLGRAVEHFEMIRKMPLRKKPATAELLAWIKILERLDIDVDVPGQLEAISLTYAVLAKSKEDKDLITRTYNERVSNKK
ncbi:MAG: MoxR family ATPase [Acidobacteria bacterium]|nr:MoxR family ATPase [Acidobacteriota bacterium]